MSLDRSTHSPRRLRCMVMPVGHQRALGVRRVFSRREKWGVGAMVACLAILAVAIVIALAGPSQTTAPGCVDVTIVGATGGASIHQCGQDAKALCRAVGQPGGYSGEAGREIGTACRKVGIPVG